MKRSTSSVQDHAKPGPAQDEHSSASAAITRKRLREKTAVPQSQGTKRKIGFPDGQVSPPTSAIANQVSGKRKRCDDSHLTESSPVSTRRTQNSSGIVGGQANTCRADISILPQLDAGILERVRDLGHYPREFNDPKTQDETDERKLFYHIKNHSKKLHSATQAELEAWKPNEACEWREELRSGLQQLEAWKQEHTDIRRQDQQCFKELRRRIDVMLSDPTRDLLHQERYVKAPPSKKKQQDAKLSQKEVSDWWFNAGIIVKSSLPLFSTTGEGNKQKRGTKVSVTLMHYLLSHVLLDDIRRFLCDRTHPARRDAPKKHPYMDFFSACRDPDKRKLAPWSASEELQVGTATFKPFQCLRYLALIEMTDKTFTSLPLDQDTLLQELATYRANEECQCQVVSEMQEAAVLRLVAYSKVQAST